MTGRPTNAASRSGIKSHVTKWINKIKDYENVSANLTIRNILLGAEQNLMGNFTKFVKFYQIWQPYLRVCCCGVAVANN